MSVVFRQIASVLGVVLLGSLFVACGSTPDDAPDADGAKSSPTTVDSADPRAAGGANGSEAGVDAPEGTVSARSSRDVCGRVPASVVGRALGVRVDDTRAQPSGTPQCTYAYTARDGTDSALTLTSWRPVDVDGRRGQAAFDYVVDLTRQLAGPGSLDSEQLDAGAASLRLTGGGLYTGVVATGRYLLTVSVPIADADATTVDALVERVASDLA